ncbi:MAG: Holliday junction resolvase RuvX [Pirellulaceae bacterium]
MNSSENPGDFPLIGRLGGVDYGHKRIGVAISDPAQKLASPLENYDRRDLEQDSRFFNQLVKDEQIVAWVIGLPLHLSGDESEKSAEVRVFADWLSGQTGLPHRFADERFSSVQAEAYLIEGGLSAKKRKKRLDMLAAQILLATYLESNMRETDDFGGVSD